MSAIPEKQQDSPSNIGADKKLRSLNANELVFAVVGPVGSGTSWVANALASVLGNATYGMDTHVIKASEAITKWSARIEGVSEKGEGLDKVTKLQDVGDRMRKSDPAAVAVELISAIQEKREELAKVAGGAGTVSEITPKSGAANGRVYILDSLKHPAEVELFRAIYKDAFCLIGVVSREDVREERLAKGKYPSSGVDALKLLMKRDENADEPHGQKVTDTFHLADFFVNNSPDRFKDKERKIANPAWDVPDQLGRLVDLLTFKKIIRPTPSETGMFHAYGAKMRSACLSRQVGAALLDGKGNVISTGTNEVPRAGGGVYGGNFGDFDNQEVSDHRCAITNKYCSSNRAQDDIVRKIIEQIPVLRDVADRTTLAKQLKKTPIGRLLEFSRAVHAEMDALMSAARIGATTAGTRLFVTTYPCHYCARHIVSAGVDEVQYIEPYPKSQALDLHGDAITQSAENWTAPSKSKEVERKALFRPFTGIAPRLYRQVFLKNRPLKNDQGDLHIGEADSASGLLKVGYIDVEKALLAGRQGE